MASEEAESEEVDPRRVYHITPRYSRSLADPRPGMIALVVEQPTGWDVVLGIPSTTGGRVTFGVPVRVGPPVESEGRLVWGLIKLGPSVWGISPSVRHEMIHAYVTIVDVPDPAPWEADAGIALLRPSPEEASRRVLAVIDEVRASVQVVGNGDDVDIAAANGARDALDLLRTLVGRLDLWSAENAREASRD